MKWKQKLLMSCPNCNAALTLGIHETRCLPIVDLTAEVVRVPLPKLGKLTERRMELLCERRWREYSFEIVENEKHEKRIRLLKEIVERRRCEW